MPGKNMVDKAKGRTNETVGAARAKAGDVTGNEKMEVKGRAQQMKGKAQSAKAGAKRAVRKAADRVKETAR